MTDDRWYARWTWGMAAIILSAGGILPMSGVISIEIGAGVTAVTGAVGLVLLLFHGFGPVRRRGYTLPNLLTASRGAAGVVLLWTLTGALPIAAMRGVAIGGGLPGGGVAWGGVNTTWISPVGALPDGWSLAIFGVLALVEVSDFFDGRIARSLGTSRFGAIWDMENDAFFTFSLSYAAWGFFAFPGVVLLIGWMRYLYFIVTRFQGDPPDYPKNYKLFAKSVAATLVIVLIGAFLVVLPWWFRVTAMWIALALQLISFGWDFALQLQNRRVVS